MIARGQVKRAGPGRWSKERERAFLEALTAEANVKRAAAAAGISTQALYRRRLKDRHFASAWDAAVETGKARLHALLVAQAERAFDPGELPIGEDEPKVTVGEAIQIARLKRSDEGKASQGGWDEHSDFDGSEEERRRYEDLRKGIVDKIQRVVERDRRNREEQGWTYDEEHMVMVPPGWVKQ